MKKISVIIVNYNTKDVLRDCLNNLNGVYENMEVIVVDNDSPDLSAQMVENEFKWVKLIKCKNLGLAVGSNVGYKNSSGDYLLYIGSDAFPQKSVFHGILDYMEKDKTIGAATAKLVTRSGQLDLDAHRGFPTPWTAITYFSKLNKLFPKSKFFNRYFQGWKNMNEPHEIDLCISHFMMIRRNIFEEIGLWDEDFFLYGEDVDFCYRIKEAGYKIMYLPQFKVLHYKGTSVGTRKETADISTATQETVVRINKETTKAMRLFYQKHYSQKYPKLVTATVLFGIDTMSALRKLRKVR